jgi:pyruvate dehydrogenase E1 component
VPAALPFGRRARRTSTQEAFGRIMGELARDEGELAARIITTSPDVTVSTSLGSWVSRRSVFNRAEHADVFKQERLASSQLWAESRRGQHVELGIAENNLFLMLAALGLSGPLFGERLIPIGTLYDPFIARGLDALTYASYQDARFLLVATPSGISLAPEGGAHQSVATPLIGIGQPELLSFEPAYADELAEILRFAFEYLQSEDGSSVYLRLSTRSIEQPEREMTDDLRAAVLAGGYWLRQPAQGAGLALVGAGAILPELLEAAAALADDLPELGILAITSADRLLEDWRAVQERRAQGESASAVLERLLAPLAPDAALVTVLDGHPATLAWLGSATGRRVYPLGVDRFGQSGDIPDLYRLHGIDADAILDRVALACIERARRVQA